MKTNRYRFKSRTKQIKEADVGVVSNLSKENAVSLNDILARDSDQSEAFKNIKKNILPLTHSLPVLIYNLPKVMLIFAENIEVCPLSGLAALQALAREVRYELAPFFDNLLGIFIGLVKRIDLLEEIFNCLSVCLKYAIKNLNPREVLYKAKDLINHDNDGVRHLAAQSFAFLVKKAGPDVLGDLLKDWGERIWELVKYSATAFHSKEILEISWECHEAARLAHLSLALQQKHTDTIFDSIVKANAFDVLIDWSIMVNGKRFPRSIHQKSIEICKTHHKIEALTYIIKYHRFLQEELNYILAQENSLRSLAIFTDFSDPHPELKLHDKLLQKRYQNHTHEMDLTQFSGKIYHVINEALKTEDSLFALEMVLFIFKRHHILPGELSNLADFIKTQTDEDALWISLRVAKLTNTKVDTEFLKDSKNQYLMREVYSINQTIPTDEIHGEILWVAAELNIQPKNVDFLYSYLTHPTLRIPATQLLSHTSEAMSLAWTIIMDNPTLETEKTKITNLKRLEHLFSQDPSGVCLSLLGLFWERYSTIWTHIIHGLSVLGRSHPDILWDNLYPLLIKLPEVSVYPPFYAKYNSFRDFTPKPHYFLNLCEVLTATPKALKLDEFVAIFVKFIDEEYAKFSWIPGYMIPKAPEDGTESKKRLPYFLKVFKEQKKLSRFSDKDTLKKIFVGLCLKKKEDIRVLAVECLINLIPELNPDIELLRKLAKEATFRDAVLSKPIVSNEICIALCAGRGFSTNMYNKSAFIYIANLPESEFLMKLLPIELKCDQIDVLEILPNKLTLNVFKSFKKIIQYVPESIKDKQEAIDFLIKVCMWGRNQDKREVLTKALSCINSIISKYECSDRSLNELLELIRPILLTFTHDLRPKYIDTLHTLIQNYEITRTDQTLIDACIGLLSNPKAETHHINKSLESISICMTETLEIEPACFIPALERVGLTNTLFAILQRIIPSVKISPLIERLLNFCIKKPEVTELLTLWLPFSENPPISKLTELVLKHQELTPLLGSCITGVAGEILKDLSATRKKGLREEAAYETQLAGIYKILDLCIEPEFLSAVINSLGQFLLSSDLGLRSAAIKSFVHLGITYTHNVEKCLSVAIKKAKDEEHIRGILQIWNTLDCEIKQLSHTDDERSLLISLGHLQIHRRSRALSSITALEFPKSYLTKLFIPLINFYLLYSSSKTNYQSNFIHQLILALGFFAKKLSWREFNKTLKIYLKKIDEEEKLVTKAIAGILANIPENLEVTAYSSLKNKILPILKMHMCDNKESWRPKVRKYVVCAMYSIIKTQSKEEANTEFYRLNSIIARHYKNKDDGTKESVIASVMELLKYKDTHNKIIKEFNQYLDAELFAHFLTKVIPSGLLEISKKYLEVVVKTLLEYEQYQTFYFLAKFVKPEHLPQILASTKPLQNIAQGLAENTLVKPEDLISLALTLLNREVKVKEIITEEVSRKIKTFQIQDGAASGHRAKVEVKRRSVGGDKVFGMRLLKLGLKRSKEGVDDEISEKCKQTAINCLSVSKDEVVAGALEVLKMFPDSSVIEKILQVSERAGEQVTIQAIKTISSLIKTRPDIESLSTLLLPQVLLALSNFEIQSSAIKLLRIFVIKKILDPLVYDCFEEIPKILLTNPKLSTQVSNLYTDFLLNYPLSDKRKQFHVDFLIKNLGTHIYSANLGIIKAISAILDKFPYEELKDNFDFLLLAIFTSISNEESEDIRKSYFNLLSKTAQKNPNSSIIVQMLKWVDHQNEAVRKTAVKFAEMCLNEKIIPSEIIKSEILPKLKDNNSIETLELLQSWLTTQKSKKLLINYRRLIIFNLEKGIDLKSEIFIPLEECDSELLKIGISAVMNNTFSHGILELFSKAEPILASRKLSTIVRKLIGRGAEDSRVENLLKTLIFYLSKKSYDLSSIFKALIIISDRSKSQILKDLTNEIFQSLHSHLSQEEFVDNYTSVKNLLNKQREDRKAKTKLLNVTNPEVAAQLKSKRKVKGKLLKKNKIFKFAPHKKIKTDDLIVKD